MRANLPSQGRLRELFDYEPDTGRLLWKRRTGPGHKVGAHNARFAGKPAGSQAVRGSATYLVVECDGSPRYAHRIIYKWMTGDEPRILDHANRDTLDNRFANLRPATDTQNQGNKRGRNNRSGPAKGVRLHAGAYCAFMTQRGKFIHLGRFKTLPEAQAAYAAAAREYFGEFAKAD